MHPNLWSAAHFLGQHKLRKVLLGAVEGSGVQAELGRLLCKIRWRERFMKIIGRRPWTGRKIGFIRLPLLVGMFFLMLVEVFDIAVVAGRRELVLVMGLEWFLLKVRHRFIHGSFIWVMSGKLGPRLGGLYLRCVPQRWGEGGFLLWGELGEFGIIVIKFLLYLGRHISFKVGDLLRREIILDRLDSEIMISLLLQFLEDHLPSR